MKVSAGGGVVEVRDNGLFVKALRPFKMKKPFSGLLPYSVVKPDRVYRLLANSAIGDFKESLEEKFPMAMFYNNLEKKTVYLRVIDRKHNADAGLGFNNVATYSFMRMIEPYVTGVVYGTDDGVDWRFKRNERGEVILISDDFIGEIYRAVLRDEEKAALEIAIKLLLEGNLRNRQTLYFSRTFRVYGRGNFIRIICPGGVFDIDRKKTAIMGVVAGADYSKTVFEGLGGRVEILPGGLRVFNKEEEYTAEIDAVSLYEIVSALRRELARDKEFLKKVLFNKFSDDFIEDIINGRAENVENPLIAGYYALKREKIEIGKGIILNIHIFGDGAAFDVEKDGKTALSVLFRKGSLYAMEKFLIKLDKTVYFEAEDGSEIKFKKREGKVFFQIPEMSEAELDPDVRNSMLMSLEQYLKKGDVRPFKKTAENIEFRMFNIFDKTGNPISGIGFRKGDRDRVIYLGVKRALRLVSVLEY